MIKDYILYKDEANTTIYYKNIQFGRLCGCIDHWWTEPGYFEEYHKMIYRDDKFVTILDELETNLYRKANRFLKREIERTISKIEIRKEYSLIKLLENSGLDLLSLIEV